MANCDNCKHAIFKDGEFWDCRLNKFLENPDEECEDFDEYTYEDYYNEKYYWDEQKRYER